jgi:polysaccharide export outer membrane protein
MKRILFLLCFTFFATIHIAYAQTPDPQFIDPTYVRAQLDSRGFDDVSFKEVKSRLIQKGIDVDNLDVSQAEAVQDALDEIFVDLQEEKDAAEKPTKAEVKQNNVENKQEEKADESEDNDLDAEIEDDAFDISEAERKKLIYGQGIFLDLNIKSYTKNSDVRPPPTYILGENDEIIVNIFGPSQLSSSYTIENGSIKPSSMERIFLKGLTFSQATKLIKKKFGQYYRFDDDEIKVALNFSRNVLVNVTGMARQFGSYNIPATNTAFTALVAAKGPNANGSVRNIMIHRSGSPSKNFDLYEYMMDPSISENFFLQNNDYVHIPSRGKVVTIDGAVIRAHKYELKGSENLKKLIFWAGGLEGNSYKKSIRIIRFEDDEKKIITINYNDLIKSGKDFKLLNGDQVDIPSVPTSYRNFVSIEGSVDLPGEYQLSGRMKIRDLILLGNPNEYAKLDLAYLSRITKGSETESIEINIQDILANPSSPANLELLPKDRIIVFSEDEFLQKDRVVKLSGAVRNPNNYEYKKDMKLSQVIDFSGGLMNDATGLAYVFRTNLDSYEPTEYLRIDIKDAMTNKNGAANILLQPQDSIVIYSFRDILIPSTVSIKGAVLTQDTFDFSSNMSLRDLLSLSGGLKLSADQAKIDIYRINIQSGEATKTEELTVEVDDNYNVIGAQNGEFLLKPFDVVNVRYTPDFELQQSVTITGEVRYPGPYSLIQANERLSDIIKRAGGFKETAFKEGITLNRTEGGLGFLVIDVIDILTNPTSPSNYILKRGDIINIPKEVNVVSIQGFTNASENYGAIENRSDKVNVPFHEDKGAKYYIDKYAGGIDKEAGGKYSLVKVRQPGGKLEKTKDFGFFKRYPKVQKGAVIIVDRKVKSVEEKERKSVDWGEVIANTVSQATAILTLVILIQQIQ